MRAESLSFAAPVDPGSFRGFYREHYGFVCHVLGRFGVEQAEHGDAVQDTFITAYRKLRSTQPDAVRPWLYGIARRVASNYRRGARRAQRKHAEVARAGLPSVAPATADALHVLDRFLDGLDDRDRELFVLSELLGFSGQELATSLGIVPRVVYARLRLLRMRLADAAPEGLFAALCRVRADEPQPTARSWMLLVPLLDAASTTTAVGSTIAFGKMVAVLAAIGATIGVVAVLPRSEPAETIVASAPAGIEPRTISPSPAEAPKDSTPAVVAPPVSRDVAPIAPRTPMARKPEPEPAPPDSTLARDNAALRAVIDAVESGDGVQAVMLADAHAREFASSPQADLRDALRIEALCLADRVDAARTAARDFAAAHLGSPAATRVRRSCAAP